MGKNDALIIVGGALAAAYIFRDEIKKTIGGVGTISQGVGSSVGGVGSALKGVGEGIGSIGAETGETYKSFSDVIQQGFNKVEDYIKEYKAPTDTQLKAPTGSDTRVIDRINQVKSASELIREKTLGFLGATSPVEQIYNIGKRSISKLRELGSGIDLTPGLFSKQNTQTKEKIPLVQKSQLSGMTAAENLQLIGKVTSQSSPNTMTKAALKPLKKSTKKITRRKKKYVVVRNSRGKSARAEQVTPTVTVIRLKKAKKKYSR